MTALHPDIDPGGLAEFSVVFTDRSLNHMSQNFQGIMRDISATLKTVYNAAAVAIVPGGGTYGMESVARQFANNEKCLIIRNGWFSYRWTQILEMGGITDDTIVMKARFASGSEAPLAPAPIDEVVARIKQDKPAVVFAPHVETASGIVLPDDYIQAVSEATRSVGGLFVLDCIASGALWVDMQKVGADVLISAPQKGWSASPCSALVMLGAKALAKLDGTTSTSFACDLKKWLQIMQAYENGGHAYHATMPTDALAKFHDALLESKAIGFEVLQAQQLELGSRVRALLEERGFKSVAAEGFKAPGVVVSYTADSDINNGSKFAAEGLQIAAGVPLQCDEPEDYRTFRIGLFGLDKLQDIDRTIATLQRALDQFAQHPSQ